MKKKKIRLYLPLIVAIALLLASTMACRREAAPDVEPTAAGGAQADEPVAEGTPDFEATAIAESTRVAEAADETPEPGETPAGEIPTEAPPAPTETPAPTTPSTTAVPTYTPDPGSPTQVPEATGLAATYTVQPGDNLFRIALRHGVAVDAIASANGIANPAMIYVGQVLTIPSSSGGQAPAGGTTYVVQAGDNLFRIALRHNMSYIYLAQHNSIANPASIYVGQVIRIP